MPTDPVCHKMVDRRHAAAICEYQGTTYYFCSSGCHKMFSANIHRYPKPPNGEFHRSYSGNRP